jgi:hypothetical protein
MADRLITPSQLALLSRSPVIGAWWEELKAQGLFNHQRPATTPLDELPFKQGHQHEEVLLEWLEAMTSNALGAKVEITHQERHVGREYCSAQRTIC